MNEEEIKELKAIKKLLMLQLMKSGATSEEIDRATNMGASNIRAMFPNVKRTKRLPSQDAEQQNKS